MSEHLLVDVDAELRRLAPIMRRRRARHRQRVVAGGTALVAGIAIGVVAVVPDLRPATVELRPSVAASASPSSTPRADATAATSDDPTTPAGDGQRGELGARPSTSTDSGAVAGAASQGSRSGEGAGAAGVDAGGPTTGTGIGAGAVAGGGERAGETDGSGADAPASAQGSPEAPAVPADVPPPAADVPGTGGSATVEVHAAGRRGDERVVLQIDGRVVAQWPDVGGSAQQGSFVVHSYQHPSPVDPADVSVWFDPEGRPDARLRVDKIVVDGVTRQAEQAQRVVTADKDNGRCTAQPEWLDCEGGFLF